MPEDLAEWLEKEAARQDRTRNNLINRIIEQYRKSLRPSIPEQKA
jgi:predicted RNase H-like nuclease (RuvC/YqgF family)